MLHLADVRIIDEFRDKQEVMVLKLSFAFSVTCSLQVSCDTIPGVAEMTAVVIRMISNRFFTW